jgi:hypothetical protein
MSLADTTVSALKAFATEVNTWTNQGSLVSINSHIATIENAAEQDVHAGETAAKAVWAELYGAFHGHDTEPLAEAPAAPGPVAEAAPAPVAAAPVGTIPAEPVASPVAVDPILAPSTTTEAFSAPSSETSAVPSVPSTSATDAPAAPATPAV